VLVWRISAKAYWKFDGVGAKRAGGRWNSPGYAIVYTSATASLAVLEFFVHLNRDRAVRQLVLTSAEIPNDIRKERVELSDLPARWRDLPSPEYLQSIGNDWIARSLSAVLAVPSAVIPQESNYLLNPAHPDFKHIRINRPTPFSFDPRII
jgi:RES domain-containing protein